MVCYRRRWPRQLVVSVSIIQEAYQLSLYQAIYDACLVARAKMAAAPFPDYYISLAETSLARLFHYPKDGCVEF